MVKSDFNLGWIFYKEGHERDKKEVALPHDAMIYEQRSREAVTAGACGYFPGGKYVYEKSFEAPVEWEGKKIILEFEGIYQQAQVYLNGQLTGTNIYGYSNFYVPLENGLVYGESNQLKVVADNSKCPNSRWYSGSGIYRKVNLYVGGECYIHPEGVKIITPEIDRIQIEADVTGGEQLRALIFDKGRKIAEGLAEIKESLAKLSLDIQKAKLWDAENPYLYEYQLELINDGKVVDCVKGFLGIRTLSWDTKGFRVNGKEVLLRGACIHHDNGILGGCSFREAEERRIRILKEAGFNAIRCSHNPASKDLLLACDKLGMYVMDEFADQWLIHKNPYDYADADFRKNWQQDLRAMVLKNYNHPSVIMNSIGNEISELALPEGQEYCRKMAEFVRSIDPSRPVTLGVNLMLCSMTAKGGGIYGDKKDKKGKKKENQNGSQTMDNAPTSTFFNMLMNIAGGMIEKMAAKPAADKASEEAFASLDIGGYNYAASRYEIDKDLHPNRVIVGSETLPKNLYKNWQLVKKLPYVIGDFMWTGWDYLGEAGIGTVRYKSFKKPGNDAPIISGGCGVIDICGKIRPEVQWNKLIWGLTNTTGIGVEPLTHAGDLGSVSMWRDTDAVGSWSWSGCEGRKTKVTVYSNGAEAELLVNGKSYGRKTAKECKTVFKNVRYEEGTITAVSYDVQGKEISRNSLKTAKGKTVLAVNAEKTELTADGQDLCYLNIDLIGEDGITKSSEDMPISIEVSGAGTLQAFGSARPNMGEDFHSRQHTTYYGKAQAVIRAGEKSGNILVKVSGEGLGTKEVSIHVKEK